MSIQCIWQKENLIKVDRGPCWAFKVLAGFSLGSQQLIWWSMTYCGVAMEIILPQGQISQKSNTFVSLMYEHDLWPFVTSPILQVKWKLEMFFILIHLLFFKMENISCYVGPIWRLNCVLHYFRVKNYISEMWTLAWTGAIICNEKCGFSAILGLRKVPIFFNVCASEKLNTTSALSTNPADSRLKTRVKCYWRKNVANGGRRWVFVRVCMSRILQLDLKVWRQVEQLMLPFCCRPVCVIYSFLSSDYLPPVSRSFSLLL